jgi:hypothetical protein
MTAETEAERQQREADFRKRMKRDGDLGLMLSQHLWDKYDPFQLGGEEFEVIGCDDVPGHEDEEYGVFLYRKSDGTIFEAEIDVSINPVRAAAEVTPLCGPT